MPAANIITGIAIAKSGLTLLARIVNAAGIPITQASLAAVNYVVTDLTLGLPIIGSGGLTIAAVVFNSLLVDGLWDKDARGYNFRWTVPAALLQNGGNRYQIDVQFVPLSGERFVQPWQFTLSTVYTAS